MTIPIPYLSFDGDCKEAMQYYQHCLGGELSIELVEDFEEGENLPADIKNRVVQATLQSESITIIGTDLHDADQLIKGNSVSILLDGVNEEDLHRVYENLSKNSALSRPLTNTHAGGFFGSLTDKFGVNWLFHFSNSQSQY
ncbi:VOC family protein [Marinoscillum sp. MHG1-6]|uniref:VOC family protein n=1 Tax=Marinoscillum sp. MHG1-6 TaxID=2959627 RepID=UPI0021575F99|nr:VOC family protein [Marinoscillum sp. MHG1-6]